MLSVFSTLKETFFLWVRNFWYLVVLTLVIGTMIVLLRQVGTSSGVRPHSHPFADFLELIASLAAYVLEAANAAAILGLLKRQSLNKTALTAVWYSIKTYTWTLFRLEFLIGLIAVVFLGGIALVMHQVGFGKIGLLFAVGLYLIFIKYALADPLVVVEKLMALPALQRSWEMTKGHFWYVAGCYIALGIANWLLYKVAGSSAYSTDAGLEWVWLPIRLGLRLFDCAWIILAWCMYLRIKEADGSPYSEAVPELSS